MKLNLLAYLITFNSLTNTNHKLCANCDNCVYENNNYKCKLFGKINLINGKVLYDHCSEARSNMTKCSPNGIYYSRYIPFEK